MMDFRRLGSAAVLGLALSASAQATQVVAVHFFGDVLSIDSTTGTATLIGSSGFARLNSLAMNPGGVLYSSSSNLATGADDALITINPATGAGSQVAPLDFGNLEPDVRSMAFRPTDGALFAINSGGLAATSTNWLMRIDAATGLGSLVAALGDLGVQGLDFSDDGVLYGWSGSLGLLTIDADTGAVTDVNPGPGGLSLQSIAFGPGGTLFGHDQVSLYSIDPATGVPSLIGGASENIRGIEIAPASGVPLPGTVALAGLGLLALWGRRGRPMDQSRTQSTK